MQQVLPKVHKSHSPVTGELGDFHSTVANYVLHIWTVYL